MRRARSWRLQIDTRQASGVSRVYGAALKDNLTIRQTTSAAESVREYPRAAGIVILDDSVFALYQAVARRATPAGARLPVLFPRSGRRGQVTATQSDPTTIELSGAVSGTLTVDAVGAPDARGARRWRLRHTPIEVASPHPPKSLPGISFGQVRPKLKLVERPPRRGRTTFITRSKFTGDFFMTHWKRLLVLGLLVPSIAAAQEPTTPAPTASLQPAPTAGLSLADAFSTALAKNPDYQQWLNNESPASMAVKSSYWTLLPSASVSGGFNYTGSGSSNFGGTNVVKTSASVGSSYSIDLGWTLDGRVINAPGQSKANLRATREQIEAAKVSLRAAVQTQYLNVLQTNARINVVDPAGGAEQGVPRPRQGALPGRPGDDARRPAGGSDPGPVRGGPARGAASRTPTPGSSCFG